MNISHLHSVGNRAKLLTDQGLNQSKYLQPDYFLSSSNNSYLGKKRYKIQQRISRIVSAALLSGLVLTTSVDASASSNTEVPVFPYGTQDHLTSKNIDSNVGAAMIPPPPPSAFASEMQSNVTNSSGKSEGRSALLSSIKNFSKKILKKVKKDPKPKVVSSDGNLMSQLHDTLESRRNGILLQHEELAK